MFWAILYATGIIGASFYMAVSNAYRRAMGKQAGWGTGRGWDLQKDPAPLFIALGWPIPFIYLLGKKTFNKAIMPAAKHPIKGFIRAAEIVGGKMAKDKKKKLGISREKSRLLKEAEQEIDDYLNNKKSTKALPSHIKRV